MQANPLVTLRSDEPLWDRFFSVFPLVLIGTREPDGGHDLAPKHMAMPMSWGRWFGFVCTPRHRTWQNATREGSFTVSYPPAEMIVGTALAASPREGCEGAEKPSLAALPVDPARSVDGVLVRGCPVYLECEVDRTIDELDGNSLVLGRVVAAHVTRAAKRAPGVDDADLLQDQGLLAYLHPGRFVDVRASLAFPFPKGFRR